MIEGRLAARVLEALLREDYAGLRRYVTAGELRLPGGPVAALRPGPGFLTAESVDPAQGLCLDDVLGAVRRLADPRDDVGAFTRECREALAAMELHEAVRPEVLKTLRDVRVTGPGTYYEALAACTDHPVYPTSRSRAGLGEEDLRRYAPEFHPAFRLRWAGVERDRVVAAGERPGWWPTPAEAGLSEDLDPFPVHPLTALPGRAPEPYLEVTPTLSMRTLAVDGRTHLKVPLPTSTLGLRNRRTIVPGTLPDGALAERILRGVLAREPCLPVLLADEQTYGHANDPLLGYLVRRFPAEADDAHVVPVAGLLAEAPDGRRVIERWDVPALFSSYLAALFDWNVTLFRYGIALEAHQQNVSLVLGGGPLRLLIKDNDGMLVDLTTLTATLGPGSYDFADQRMTTEDPEALARVFVTITLHLCAGAVAFGLAEHGLLPLRTGLGLIRERLDAALEPGEPGDSFLRARTLDAARLPTKAMLTAGTLVDKARTGALDINKHYGPDGPNYLDYFRDDTCS